MSSDKFEIKGYLSSFVYEYRTRVRATYEQEFIECEEVSECAQREMLDTTVHPEDPPILAAYLFVERTIRGAQASIRLCEIGLVQEAQVLIRAAFETAFHAAALVIDPGVFRRLASHEAIEDAKQAKEIIKTAGVGSLTADQINDLDKVIARSENEKIKQSVYESAKTADLLHVYSTAYRGLSSLAGHATFRSLDRAFVEGEGEPELTLGPSDNQLVFTLSLAAGCLEIVRNVLKIIVDRNR